MTSARPALLLLGSPRQTGSNSLALGNFLLERLAAHGLTTATHRLETLPGSPAGNRAVLKAVEEAGLVILAFPLYVDCQPAHVIRAMAVIASRPRAGPGKGLVALVNCGFPEPRQTRTALAICRRFAAAAGFRWLGGLGVGMGEAIGGRPLAEVGAPARHAMEALELAAGALARDGEVPPAAAELLSRQLVPPARFVAMGNRYWERKAGNGEPGRLRDRPYRR